MECFLVGLTLPSQRKQGKQIFAQETKIINRLLR